MQIDRKLATIRIITEIKPHNNADSLEIAMVNGWQVVVKKGEFIVNQPIVYFEIDSWLPNTLAPFLSRNKEPQIYNEVKGERLRTIKLRGELSQGLILNLYSVFDAIANTFNIGDDVTKQLNINKWEKPLNPQLAGFAKGNFPSFIPKTDQERIQNIYNKLTDEQINDSYEVSLKLDGSSCTFYYNEGLLGVCSRNLELKIDESNSSNAFVAMFNNLGLKKSLLALGKNIAIQGELWGFNINGNHEGVDNINFSVFDVFDIDTQKYFTSSERLVLINQLNLIHVPTFVSRINNLSLANILDKSDIPSLHNSVAEGLVYKSITNPEFSFKAINNKFLLLDN